MDQILIYFDLRLIVLELLVALIAMLSFLAYRKFGSRRREGN